MADSNQVVKNVFQAGTIGALVIYLNEALEYAQAYPYETVGMVVLGVGGACVAFYVINKLTVSQVTELSKKVAVLYDLLDNMKIDTAVSQPPVVVTPPVVETPKKETVAPAGITYGESGSVKFVIFEADKFTGKYAEDIETNDDRKPWMTVVVGNTFSNTMWYEPGTNTMHIYKKPVEKKVNELYFELCEAKSPIQYMIDTFKDKHDVEADLVFPLTRGNAPVGEFNNHVARHLADTYSVQLIEAKELFFKYTGYKR